MKKINISDRFKNGGNIKEVYVYISGIVLVFIMIIGIPLIFPTPSASDKNIAEQGKNSDLDTVTVKKIKNNDCSHIKVYITDTKKVINMDMEEYITGVVAAEMPAAFDIEALKAQAVAARTFAINHIIYKGCNKFKDSDICDSVHCQAYVSKEKRIEGWPKGKGTEYWEKIEEAVKSTKGEVLSYDGELIQYPQYFAVSGGKTEDAVDVFSIDAPYLKSKESKGENIAPKYSSEVRVKIKDLVNKINSSYPNAKLNEGNIKSTMEIESRTQGGSVKELRVGNENITGIQFRELFKLNSANFTFKILNGECIISCLGYGHGVGMSQWGANIKAKDGVSYKEILQYYYEGTKIEKIN